MEGISIILYFISKDLANFFASVGVPIGNKTNVSYLTPVWIFNGNLSIKSSFLRALFDTGGCIHSTRGNKKPRWRIAFEMYKNEKLQASGIKFFTQVQAMLNDLGVMTSPIRTKKGNLRKDGSKSLGLVFEIELSSFQNFYKHINFHNKDKQAKLLAALGGNMP